jgi:hypothetical protein
MAAAASAASASAGSSSAAPAAPVAAASAFEEWGFRTVHFEDFELTLRQVTDVGVGGSLWDAVRFLSLTLFFSILAVAPVTHICCSVCAMTFRPWF